MRRSISAVITFALIAGSSTTLAPTSASAAPATEIPTEMRSQLQSALSGLREASMLPQLLGAIPGLGESPASLLGLHDVFEGLANATATAPTEADLAAALDTLEGTLPSGFDFSGVSVTEDGDITTMSFDLTLAGTRSAELALATDDAILVGSDQDIGVSINTTTFAFEYDASIASPADAFSIVAPMPSMAISLDADVAIADSAPENVVFGFASAEATGSASFHVGFGAGLIDPDADGHLTGAELAILDIVDLVQLDLAASGDPDVSIALDLDADVFGTTFSATLGLTDDSLFEGDPPEPTIGFDGTGEQLELLTNFSGESAITALTQMVSGFGGAMIGGDVDLPFLNDGVFIPGDLAESDDFDRIFEAIKPLMTYVEPRAAGQIVCGTGQMPPEEGGAVEGIPYGQTLFVTTDDTVYCRTYTAEDGTNVQWSIGDGTEISALTVAESVGVAPTKNISFTPGSDGPIDVSVTFDADSGGSVQVLPRPETIQALLLELLDAGLIPEAAPDIPAFTFQPATESLEVDLGFTAPGFERDVSVNAGSELVADTGLTGLQASGSVDAELVLGDISAAVTLGLILTDDVDDIEGATISGLPELEPGPGNRFYVKNAGELLTVDTVVLDGMIDLVGRLGFLDVTAELYATLGPVDDAVDAPPAVSVGFGPDLGINVDGTAVGNATLVADLLRSGPTAFDLSTNLQLVADLGVSSSVGIQGVADATASGSVHIEWDLADAEPSVTPQLDFTTNLLPFDTPDELTYDGSSDPGDEAIFVADEGGLLTRVGLVGSTIDDGAGDTCTIVAVVDDTTLRCENPMPIPGSDQIDLNPIAFTDGQTYQVSGNTLAFLSEILAGLEMLTDSVESVVDTGVFQEPIPVIGVRPADLVDHVKQLRKMIDEFRGIQDGTVNCALDVPPPGDGDPPVDIRAVNVTAFQGDAVLCSVSANASSPSDVRFRVVDLEVGAQDVPGAWLAGAAGAVAPTPSETVSFTLDFGALDDDGDGYVSLGDEYTIEAEWVDNDEPKSAALPPRVPQSIEQLEEYVEQVLHLPAESVDFVLDLSQPDPSLRMTFKYGICSATAPSTHTDECADMPTGPSPSASLNMEMGSLPDFVGLDTDGTVAVQYAAVGTFSVGIPLSDPTDPTWSPLVYGDTGLDLAIMVEGENLQMNASIGPANAHLGTQAALSGTADNDPDDGDLPETLVDDGNDLGSVPDGTLVTRTGDDETCLTTAASTDVLDCDIADGWALGDQYVVGGLGVLEAGLSFAIDVLDGGSEFGDDTAVPFGDVTFDVTDFEELTGGSGDCGSIDLSRFQVVEVLGQADGSGTSNATLTGLACGMFSIELEIGSGEVYLGEIAFEWSSLDDLTVYVPADLVTRLGDALLDPSFILQALPGLLLEIENGLRDAATSGLPAAVADPLHLGADGIGAIRIGAEELADVLGPAVDELEEVGDVEGVATLLETELTELFQPTDSGFTIDLAVSVMCGGVPCNNDDHSFLDIDDVSASVTFGGEWRASTGVNLGLEGMPLSFEGGVEAYAGFSATLGMGVNLTDGPYLLLNDPAGDPEFSIEAGIEIPDNTGLDCESGLADSVADSDYVTERCLKGKLVFLFIEALDHSEDGTGRSTLNASVGFDVTSAGPVDSAGQKVTLGKIVSGDLGIDLAIEGNIHLDFHIRTGVDIPGVTGAGDLPSLLGTFLLDWSISLDDDEIPTPIIEFGNLHLDVGTFLAQFINPIAKEIKKITGPLQPIIDTLMAPIPVISDLAELVGQPPVTMISLLEVATGADLSLVRSVAAFITFFNQIAELDSTLQIPLGGLIGDDRAPGDFTVDAAKASSSVAPAQATSLISGSSPDGKGSGFVNDVAGDTGLPAKGSADDGRPTTFGVPGLSFPFLEDATQLFGLLVGSDVTLIRWDAGTLEASAGFSYDFGPIMAGPVPITITIGGEIGVRGRFAIGYDTYGIRQLLDGGSGTALFDGIFIDDLDANGNDVPEIEFFGKVFAGASVDLVIVSAGVRGGIELTFALDLDDRPDPDGKLRIEEIVDKLQNPICLFVVNGKIEAFLEVFVEIDLFLWSEEFSFELVRVTLLEWSSACEPPEPDLGDETVDPDGHRVLTLHVGELRNQRNIAEDQENESVEVRQIGAGKVRVSGFGWEEVHSEIDLIVANAGDGDDELKFLNGTLDGTDGSGEDDLIPWDIPVVASGGPGDDIIVVEGTVADGGSDDKLLGDAPTGTSWLGTSFAQPPTEEPGEFDDDYDGDDDHINAGPGDDLVDTGVGDDEADGEFGADTVLGGSGNDDLDGGPGPDVVDGQGDNDTVQGGPIEQPDADATNAEIDDDDLLIGGPGRDVASGDFGNDLVFGDDPEDAAATTDAGSGRLARIVDIDANFSTWCAANGTGTDGDDILTGTAGNDYLVGGAGDDSIDGGDGNDRECGGPDEDTVLGGAGNDDLFGDGEDDVLEGNDGADYVRGGSGNDLVNGNDGNDDIFGDAGSDLLYGDVGDDIIVGDGGTLATHSNGVDDGGDDVVAALVTALDDALTVDGAGGGDTPRDCPAGGPVGDSDCIYGGAGSDALFGGNDADVMRGDAGVDFLEGNAGADNMRGGTENDVLLGSAGTDTIYGDSGADGAFGDRSITEWEANTPSTGAIDTIYGGPGADHLEGDGADDDLYGGAANDHIEGNNGQDEILGEAGDDDLIGGSDTAFGTGDSDDVGEISIFGGTGSDVIAGDNAIIAASGYVLGRSVELLDIGNDDVGGGDTIEGDGATDAIFGQAGDDTLWGDHGIAGPVLQSAGPDYIEGNDGNDTIHGEAGADDLVGGSSTGAVDGVVDADRDGTGVDDEGETAITGDNGRDWIAGDNARFDRVLGNGEDYPSATVTPILLFDLATTTTAAAGDAFGPDAISGGDATDLIFGQGGDDALGGDAGNDYIEGNDGDDTILGSLGDDDLIGGGSASNGLIVELRVGAGLLDGGETSISGGDGRDSIAGDNARMNRVLFQGPDYPDPTTDPIVLFDLQRSELVGDSAPGVVSVDGTGVFGDDTATGGDGTDLMFGQGGDDVLDGDGAADYIEGNDGNDDISGGDGDDDIVGGGSARDGVIDPIRIGDGLHDEGETLIEGNAGVDWIMGDNAFSNRVLFADTETPIDLFDVNSTDVDVSGGDLISGGTEADLIFGQGNGAQGDQSDPSDGVDNDGDSALDEDGGFGTGWLGDWISGDEGDDYIEGNHGADFITGGEGDDDIAGGGSAIDGVIDDDRIGDGLRDARDTVYGDGGEDVIAGDNARVGRGDETVNPLTGLLTGTDREVLLFDVNSTDALLSGGDFLAGGSERDLVFGQGNGSQTDQADPIDGVDNDFDGREGPDSAEYDCADNGFDNDAPADGPPDGADGDDPECQGAIDEDQLWDGDIIHGNDGDDYLEGNHGADWMFGGGDEDDMIGGGSAGDGAIVPDRNPEGLLDGPDVMHGDDEDDVMTGDNARINRVIVGTQFARIGSAAGVPEFGPYDQATRITDMFAGDDGEPGPDTNGDDYMTGGTGNDEMYGQLGADFILGNAGDDGMVGDLGQVRANVLGDGVGVDPAPQAIATNSPHWDDVIYEVGSLLYETELYAFDTSAGGVGGNDVIVGYDGRDTAFGGPGDDVIQGDGDATEEFFDAEQPEFTHMVDVDPDTADRDQLFGGDDADAIWGGRDNDILMGGYGDDNLDVRPREMTDNGRNGANFRIIPRDPPSWFTWALPENFQDVDFIYGGWDRDALQADQAENGPDPGDRLADWAGGFNVFYLCPAGYGDHTITRMGAPHARDFLRDLTQASGAYLTATDGASGFRDLGYVFPNQRGQNSHPPHPDHPGHFTCADYGQVGSDGVAANAGGPYEVPEGGSIALDAGASTGAVGFEWTADPFGIDSPTSATPTISAAGLDDGDGPVMVEVEVIDGNGTFDTSTAEVTIVNVAPEVSVMVPTEVFVDDAVELAASFTDPGVDDTHTFEIDWGDGGVCDGSSGCTLAQGAGGGEVTGSHTYSSPGAYDVTVRITDNAGGVGASVPISVSVSAAPALTAATWSAIDPWPLDPLEVGGEGYTRAEAIDVFDDGGNNERSPYLFRELVAALLNQEAGADASCVAATMAGADAWLVANPPGSGVKKNKAPWKNGGELLFAELADYNAGLLCAPGG